MKRIAVLLGLGLLLVGTGYAQQNAPRFTGKSETMDGKELSVARRSFEAGGDVYTREFMRANPGRLDPRLADRLRRTT